jgi:hypothetical protein
MRWKITPKGPEFREVSSRLALVLSGLLLIVATGAPAQESTSGDLRRTLYAVNQAASNRGSISVYDIDAEHRLIKTIPTVAGVKDIKGVVASAVTGKLYVAYLDGARTGRIFCANINNDTLLWDRRISPGVDRLAINPDGRLLYVPTWEHTPADFINVVDADTGEVVRRVYFSNHSHDTQYPLSGPIYQETKADDGSGDYLYLIDPRSYAVSRVGPYSGILGPYAVDGASNYVVNNVVHLWGMQVADLKTGTIITATLPTHPPGDPGLMHGIGWTPDESEVWQSGTASDVYIWDMHNPMTPVFKKILTLRTREGSHWLTFTINGDFGYIAPEKNNDDETEVFTVRTHVSAGVIASSEDMLEIDFANGKIAQVGDQFGIGRRPEPQMATPSR